MAGDKMRDKEVGKLIREAREARQLTRKEAAEKLGIWYDTLGRWERGEYLPRIEVVKRRLKEVLGVDLDRLKRG